MKRVLCSQLVELAHELPVPAEGELRVDALLEGRQSDLLQTLDRDLGERLVLEVCEGRAAPESQGIALQLERRLTLAARERTSCFFRQPFELLQVELLRSDANHVSGRPRLEPCVLAEHLAELGDLAVHLRRRRGRCAPRIELIGEAVDRDDPVGIEQQDRERRPLLRPAERKRSFIPDDLERAQDPELEHRLTVAVRSRLGSRHPRKGGRPAGWRAFLESASTKAETRRRMIRGPTRGT